MKHIKLENYRTSENSYLIYDPATKQGAVIDPGNPVSDILDAARANGIEIRYILLTHCHYDHIEYLNELRAQTGAYVVTGDKCAINLCDPDINLTYAGLGYDLAPKRPEIVLADGEEFAIGEDKVRCIYTPGHTNCSVCYLADDGLYAGDTLFLRSCGRWDLPTGNEAQIRRSIVERLYTLPDDTPVYPGHSGDTTIGYEKRFNFVVRS